MSLDLTIKVGRGCFIYRRQGGQCKIYDSTTFFTDEVMMGRSVCIKMIYTVSYTDLGNLTDIR